MARENEGGNYDLNFRGGAPIMFTCSIGGMMEVIAGFLFVILFILVYICLCYIHKILELIQMINDILQIYIGKR